MRWSQTFIPTLRDNPANVQAVSHGLLVRAGYIQQIVAGAYSLLPLAQKVRNKVINIIRKEMDKIGAQEFYLAALQPMELWEESGRRKAVSDVMFSLTDRKGSELALGLTHEEVFTSIARTSLTSYKQLPQIWYQIQTKFRDELRPKGGLLRVREFTMKDSYSFDIDEDGLDRSFLAHRDAYREIFSSCGINFVAVDASSGAMGGSASTEFMVLCESGEDTVITCDSCDYAANIEKAESMAEALTSGEKTENELEKFPTPGIKTIKQLEDFEGGASAQKQIKTLVYNADGKLLLALLRGDQELNESKLQSALKASTLRAATEDEIKEALGASPGSLGACGVKSGEGEKISAIFADARLTNAENMVTGANEDNFHFRHVSMNRDIKVDQFFDLHTVKAGEICSKCRGLGEGEVGDGSGGKLSLSSGLEIGHIFKLGTRYTESMNAKVLLADSSRKAPLMGSYGIGVERLMAAIVEQHHDAGGIIWPLAIAPYQVIVVPVNWKDEVQREEAIKIYEGLRAEGVEVLLDDREERAGVKFNDADLIGIPFRLTVGKKITEGLVELTTRSTLTKTEIPVAKACELIAMQAKL